MKKLKLWVAVDGDGLAYIYTHKPKWCHDDRLFRSRTGDSACLGAKIPTHAGQCWRLEITPPPVKKNRTTSRPSSEPQVEWWDNKKETT